MKTHLKLLTYLIKHKFFVAYAGYMLDVPIWRLIKHDWTKLLPCEWLPYRDHFHGNHNQATWDAAWNHHIHNNDHHWQFWVTLRTSRELKALEMPEAAVREMVADWLGAGRTLEGKWVADVWFAKNRSTILLHPRTLLMVEVLLNAWFQTYQSEAVEEIKQAA